MNRKKNKLVITTALVCSLAGLTACSNPFMASISGGMGGGVPVESTILNSTPVSQSSIYQATLISRHSTSLQPQVAGQIADIHVKAGDRVKAGQLLMVIDKKKQEAALNSSYADAKALSSTIAQAGDILQSYQIQRQALKSNLELNQKLYNRYSALYAKKSVSQQELEKYTDSLNKAKTDLNANISQIQAQRSAVLTAKSNYEKALADIQEQSVELQFYKIKAPYSGIIGDIPVKVGSYVQTTTPLLSITQNDFLEINVGLPVEKVFDIKAGLPVEVLDNNNNVVGSSEISFISPSVNTNTQTILVKAILHNTKGVLKADQSVKVRVIYSKAPGILVPTGAVSHLGGQDFVFVINKKGSRSFVKQQSVKIGELQRDKYVVLSGLNAGDEIVLQGIQKLMDGAPVTNIANIAKGK